MHTKKEEMSENTAVSNTLSSFNDEAENFFPTKEVCGNLLTAKKEIHLVMELDTVRTFDLKKDELILILYDFTNKTTKQRALLFLYNNKKCMYITDNIEEEFTISSPGMC